MNYTKLENENDFLTSDLAEAKTLTYWSSYCLAQLDKCSETTEKRGALHWGLDYERAINDLKFLKFKKIDHERKMKNEKRHEGA